MVSLKVLDRLCGEVLSPALGKYGFLFQKGAYYRDLPNRLRNVIIMDIDVRTKKTYRVIVGLNSKVVAADRSTGEIGVYFARYFVGGAISEQQRNYACFDDKSALASLEILKNRIEDVVLPWFDQYQTLSQFADVLGVEDSYVKGKLYFEDGNLSVAVPFLEAALARGQKMIPTKQVTIAMDEVRTMLQQAQK